LITKKLSVYGPFSSVYNDLIDICVITGANLIHFSGEVHG